MADTAELLDWDQIKSDPEFSKLPVDEQLSVLDGWREDVFGNMQAEGADDDAITEFDSYVGQQRGAINGSTQTTQAARSLAPIQISTSGGSLLGGAANTKLTEVQATQEMGDWFTNLRAPLELSDLEKRQINSTIGGLATKEKAPDSGGLASMVAETAKIAGNSLAFLFDLVGDKPEDDPDAYVRKTTLPAALRELANEKVDQFYGVDSESDNTTAQIGRGAGMVLTALPTLMGGWMTIPAMITQMSGAAYEEAYDAKEAELADQPEETRREMSQAAGTMAFAKSFPALGLYMVGGKLAAKFASRLVGLEASAVEKTMAGFAGAAISNVGAGSVIRALEAEPGKRLEAALPSIENLTADTLFAVIHARGTYREASEAARARATEEAKRRGFTDEEIRRADRRSQMRSTAQEGEFTDIREGETPADVVVPKLMDRGEPASTDRSIEPIVIDPLAAELAANGQTETAKALTEAGSAVAPVAAASTPPPAAALPAVTGAANQEAAQLRLASEKELDTSTSVAVDRLFAAAKAGASGIIDRDALYSETTDEAQRAWRSYLDTNLKQQGVDLDFWNENWVTATKGDPRFAAEVQRLLPAMEEAEQGGYLSDFSFRENPTVREAAEDTAVSNLRDSIPLAKEFRALSNRIGFESGPRKAGLNEGDDYSAQLDALKEKLQPALTSENKSIREAARKQLQAFRNLFGPPEADTSAPAPTAELPTATGVPLPTFSTAQDVVGFVEQQRTQMLSRVQEMYGVDEPTAKKLIRGFYNEDASDSAYNAADAIREQLKLTPKQETEIEAFEKEDAFTPSTRFPVRTVSELTYPREIASTIVNSARSLEGASKFSETRLTLAAAVLRAQELGVTVSDLARYIDDFTTRNAGSESSKAEYFQALTKQVGDAVKALGIELPAGDLFGAAPEKPKALAATAPAATGRGASAPESNLDRVKAAIARLRDTSMIEDQMIVDVAKESGLTTPEVHAAILEGGKAGDLVPTRGDWSFATPEARQAALLIQDEASSKLGYPPEHLQVRLAETREPERVKAARLGTDTPPEAGSFDYPTIAAENLRSREVTKSLEPTAEERIAIRKAYDELVEIDETPAIAIGDVMRKAGIPIERKGVLMDLFNKGEIVSLPSGDYSLRDPATQAWGVRNLPGMDTPALLMRMGPEKPAEAPAAATGQSNLTATVEKNISDAKMMAPKDPAGFLRKMADSARKQGREEAALNFEAAIESFTPPAEEPVVAEALPPGEIALTAEQHQSLADFAESAAVRVWPTDEGIRETHLPEIQTHMEDAAREWAQKYGALDAPSPTGQRFSASTVARNKALDIARLKAETTTTREQVDEEGAPISEPADEQAAPDQQVQAADDYAALTRALATLPEDLRFLVEGKMKNISQADMAQQLGITPQDASRKMAQAMKRLRQSQELQEYAADWSSATDDSATLQPQSTKGGKMKWGRKGDEGFSIFPQVLAGAGQAMNTAGKAVANSQWAKEQFGLQPFSDARRATLSHEARAQVSFGEVSRASRALNKAFTTPEQGNAAAVWLEAAGDPVELQRWASEAHDPTLRKAAEDALKLTPDQIALLLTKAIPTFERIGARAERYDLLKASVQNYVPHLMEDRQTGREIGGPPSERKLRATTARGKERVFETFFEADQAATLPDGSPRYRAKTIDLRQLLPQYIHEINRAINAKELVRDAAAGKALDGRPLVVPRNEGVMLPDGGEAVLTFERPLAEEHRDYKDLGEHPALRDWRWAGKDTKGANILRKSDLLVHPEFYKFLNAAIGQSQLPEILGGGKLAAVVKGIEVAQQYAKGTMMGFLSPFHQVTEAEHAIGHRTNPIFGFPNPDPSQNPRARFAAEHGLMLYPTSSSSQDYTLGVGGKSKNLTTLLLRKIPGLNAIGGRALANLADAYQDYLFHKFIPSLKLKTFENALARNLHIYASRIADGTYTDDQVAHLTAQQMNAAYGHLNYADMRRNPTLQHVARMFLLAPDFLEARARFAGQSFFRGKRGVEQLKAMLFGSGVIIAAAWAASKLGGGKWDAKDPFVANIGNRKYRLRNVAEDFLPIVKDVVKSIHEGHLTAEGTRQFFDSRLSPLVGRGLLEFASGVNWRGEKTDAGDIAKDIATNAVLPMGIRAMLDLTETDRNRPVSKLEQALRSLGVNISRASPITKAYEIAKEWKKTNGIEDKGGTYPVSKYQQLRYALEDDDSEKSREEIKKLEATPNKRGIVQSFRQSLYHPFAGSSENDRKMLESLVPEERESVLAAKARRDVIFQRFLKLRR